MSSCQTGSIVFVFLRRPTSSLPSFRPRLLGVRRSRAHAFAGDGRCVCCETGVATVRRPPAPVAARPRGVRPPHGRQSRRCHRRSAGIRLAMSACPPPSPSMHLSRPSMHLLRARGVRGSSDQFVGLSDNSGDFCRIFGNFVSIVCKYVGFAISWDTSCFDLVETTT